MSLFDLPLGTETPSKSCQAFEILFILDAGQQIVFFWYWSRRKGTVKKWSPFVVKHHEVICQGIKGWSAYSQKNSISCNSRRTIKCQKIFRGNLFLYVYNAKKEICYKHSSYSKVQLTARILILIFTVKLEWIGEKMLCIMCGWQNTKAKLIKNKGDEECTRFQNLDIGN